jgi:HSF-type DNA-binding
MILYSHSCIFSLSLSFSLCCINIHRHFNQSKLTSFQRQCNLYGFQRQSTGRDRGAYYHELFLRGRPDLAKIMVRTRVKGFTTTTSSKETAEGSSSTAMIMSSGVAAGAGEPSFYSMPVCSQENFLRRPKEDAVINNNNNNMTFPITPNSPKSVSNINTISMKDSACLSPVPSENKPKPCLAAAVSVATPSPRRVTTLSLVPFEHQAPHRRQLQQQQYHHHHRTALPVPTVGHSGSSSCLKMSPQRRTGRRATAPHLFRQAAVQKLGHLPPVPMTTVSPGDAARYRTGRGGCGGEASGDHHQQDEWYAGLVTESPLLLELQEQQESSAAAADAAYMSCPTAPRRTTVIVPNSSHRTRRSYSLSPIPPCWAITPSNSMTSSSSSSSSSSELLPPLPFFPLTMPEMPDMMMSQSPHDLVGGGLYGNSNSNNNSSRFHLQHQTPTPNLTPRRVSNMNDMMADHHYRQQHHHQQQQQHDTTATSTAAAAGCDFFEGHEFQVIDDASLEAFESAMQMHMHA